LNGYLSYIATLSSPEFGVFILIRTGSAPPRVVSGNYDYLTATHKLVVEFSKDVSASLSTADLQVQNLTTAWPVTVSGLSYNSATNTATFTFTPAILGDGNYRATLLASGIADGWGNPLDGNGDGVGGDNYLYNFYFLAADANRDRKVDIIDMGIVGTNWQQLPRTWPQGDFDYSGKVDIADLGMIGSNWQKYLAPPVAVSESSAYQPLQPAPAKKTRSRPRT
jgi:hypothetical protein